MIAKIAQHIATKKATQGDTPKKGFTLSANINVEKVQKIALTSLLSIGVLWGGRKLYKKYKKGKVEKNIPYNTEAQQAMALKIAMNPSGIEWMRRMDFSKVPAMYKVADNITNLEAVAKAYRNLYAQSLYDELQAELKPEEYQRFLQLAANTGTKDSTVNTGDYVPEKKWAYTTNSVTIRSSAAKKGSYNWQFNDNIITKVDAGKVLGMTTGKQIYDAENDVLFAEIKATTDKKRPTNIYAWKGALKFQTKEEIMASHNGKMPLILIRERDL